ncbi:hypothetical protein A2U01_0058201, partial [Trifolium medium]|nr:hypothetical protein [Trifolium medium]
RKFGRKNERKSYEADVGAATVDVPGVSGETPTSGAENWEPVRDLVIAVRGTSEDVRTRRAQLMVTCIRIQGTLGKRKSQ